MRQMQDLSIFIRLIILCLLFTLVTLLPVAAQEDEPQPIEVGDTVEGTLVNGEAVEYAFEATEGDVITISMTGDFDTFLFLNDAEGMMIAENDDAEAGVRDSLIRAFSIPADGTYVIRADSFDATASGNFTLTLESFDSLTIAPGEMVTGTFTPDMQEITVAVDAEAGQVLDFIVDSGNQLDTEMELISPFNFVVAESQDTNDSVDPALTSIILDTAGTYFVVIVPQNANAELSGDVMLTVRDSNLLSLNDNPATLEFDQQVNQQVLTFDGVAEETVTLIFEVEQTNEFARPFVQLIQNNQPFATFNINNFNPVIVDVAVPADGEVAVIIQVFQESTVTVSLDPQQGEE